MAEGEDLTINVPLITKQDTVNFKSKAAVTSFMTLHLPSAAVVGQNVINDYLGDKMFAKTARLDGRTLGAILMMYAKVIKKQYPNYMQHERALLTNISHGLTSEEAKRVYTETVENLLGKYADGYAFDDLMLVLCITSAIVNRSLLDHHHERALELTDWLVKLLEFSIGTYYDPDHKDCPYWKALQNEKTQEFAAELAKLSRLPGSKTKTLNTFAAASAAAATTAAAPTTAGTAAAMAGSTAATAGTAAAAAGGASFTAGVASDNAPTRKRKFYDSAPASTKKAADNSTVPATAPAGLVAAPAGLAAAPACLAAAPARLAAAPAGTATVPTSAGTDFQLSLLADISVGDEQLDLEYSFAMPNVGEVDDNQYDIILDE